MYIRRRRRNRFRIYGKCRIRVLWVEKIVPGVLWIEKIVVPNLAVRWFFELYGLRLHLLCEILAATKVQEDQNEDYNNDNCSESSDQPVRHSIEHYRQHSKLTINLK